MVGRDEFLAKAEDVADQVLRNLHFFKCVKYVYSKLHAMYYTCNIEYGSMSVSCQVVVNKCAMRLYR